MKPYLKYVFEIEKHNLFRLYFTELGSLSKEIVKNCELIFEKTPLPEKAKYTLIVSGEIHNLINLVLIYSTKIKRLIETPKRKGKNEREVLYNAKCRRIEILKSYLKDLEISEIMDNKLRNSVEHFDEYLDDEIIRLMKDQISDTAGHYLVLSHWETFNPRPLPIRVYISSERKYYNLKYSIDLNKIYNEAKSIFERLVGLNLIPGKETEYSNTGLISF